MNLSFQDENNPYQRVVALRAYSILLRTNFIHVMYSRLCDIM